MNAAREIDWVNHVDRWLGAVVNRPEMVARWTSGHRAANGGTVQPMVLAQGSVPYEYSL